ncbi:YdcF family protein [Candidatus Deferrimicrobium sp.]|uniref:YdcF family protein n=1 Tax=Candidatus Deferrimicrobium sp. TaxID=3060586 RepID=UPI003C3F0FBE
MQSGLLKDRRSRLPDRRAHRGRFTRVILSLLLLLIVPPAIPHLLSNRDPAPPARPADAIFVLTGGEGRIQEGYRAWSSGAARELFILGAGRWVPVTRILPEVSRIPAEALSRIHVEGWSENTLENAFSAKSAVGEGKFSSVILVTSDYHVPRAVLAFRKVLPPDVALSVIRVGAEGGDGASWRWARRRFLEGWKYWGYRILLRWE